MLDVDRGGRKFLTCTYVELKGESLIVANTRRDIICIAPSCVEFGLARGLLNWSDFQSSMMNRESQVLALMGGLKAMLISDLQGALILPDQPTA